MVHAAENYACGRYVPSVLRCAMWRGSQPLNIENNTDQSMFVLKEVR